MRCYRANFEGVADQINLKVSTHGIREASAKGVVPH